MKIATIRGVDLKIHYSLLFLLAYIVLVTGGQFPSVVERIFFAMGLFLSVVLHEFGHVIVAQSMGVKVRGITLMMLGGVSEMDRIPDHKYAEFKVAVVGPLVSFAIAGALFALQGFAPSSELTLFSYWLARANLVLGIFNLFPAFPLDGGRVLRSLLASRQGAIRATRNAARVARVFAWGFGILGLLGFNLLLVVIAIFIYSAANSELALMLSREVLRGLKVEDVGIRLQPVHLSDSLEGVAARMARDKLPVLPVQTFRSDEGAVVTVEQIRRVPRSRWRESRVENVLKRVPKSLRPNEEIEDSLHELSVWGALPTYEGNQVVGMVRYRDVVDVIEFRALEQSEGAEERKVA